MKSKEIFNSWGDILYVDSYEEFMSIDNDLIVNYVLDRNLLVIKGIGPDLTDEEFYALGNKFGRVWTQLDYRKSFITYGIDSTIDKKSKTPVSYFKTNNNMFKDEYMGYHADMAHIMELSYPGRVLYMVNNTLDGSGDTTWLNLEHGWAQLSQAERDVYKNYEVVFQDYYIPETRMEKFPFVKINPKTGRESPRINCFSNIINLKAWIHHIEKDGKPLDFDQTELVICSMYEMLEEKLDTVYTHHWETGDIIVYDNWFNVHKREKVNGARLLKRLTFNFL